MSKPQEISLELSDRYELMPIEFQELIPKTNTQLELSMDCFLNQKREKYSKSRLVNVFHVSNKEVRCKVCNRFLSESNVIKKHVQNVHPEFLDRAIGF